MYFYLLDLETFMLVTEFPNPTQVKEFSSFKDAWDYGQDNLSDFKVLTELEWSAENYRE